MSKTTIATDWNTITITRTLEADPQISRVIYDIEMDQPHDNNHITVKGTSALLSLADALRFYIDEGELRRKAKREVRIDTAYLEHAENLYQIDHPDCDDEDEDNK